ncbi:unnamed protein product, partial [Brachionus calyciflorus]
MEIKIYIRDFYLQIFKWMIYKRIIETLVTTLLIVKVILIILLAKRGRQASQKSNSTSTTNVNYNTLQLEAQDPAQSNTG